MCIQQNFSCRSVIFDETGLIASAGGNMLIKQSSIIFTAQSTYDLMDYFGNFGVVSTYGGQSTNMLNILIIIKVQVSKAINGGFGFFGGNLVSTSVIKNSQFKNFNITTSNQVGIICGYQYLGTNTIINTTVYTCNISAGSAGGFIANAWNYTNYIQNSTIQNINITGIGQYDEYKQMGVMIGYMVSDSYLNSYIENSSIINNNINGISVTSGFFGQIDSFSMSPQQQNISFIDILIVNNNISGNMFTSGLVASFSVVCDQQILLLQNLTIQGCNIQCITGSCGGLIGTFSNEQTQGSILTAKNITMKNLIISGPSYIGGFLAISKKCVQQTTLQIYNSTVTSIVLSGQNCGMVTGFLNGTSTFDIQTSKTTGNNFVNSTQIQNCASITSGISQSGC
ncbi:Hypothetical_protein [Hexamita inflata]|uniref:Hypothetical_protein n=1 Tax=Hexamita inflata TaxID=28002 RepID=A0AA86P822_9EUKA|nr:Hypothetical protein HINF_LOCUS20333 [Hexamita inflata]